MADADAQTMEVTCAAKGIDDVTQAVLAAVAAAELEAGSAHIEVDLVVSHQHVFRCDIEIAAESSDRLATAVHVGGREEQAQVVTRQGDAAGVTEELALTAQLAVAFCCHTGQKPGTSVVAVTIVLRAWISQAHNQFQGITLHRQRST